MILVPQVYAADGTALTVVNGDPAAGRDASEADRLVTHLMAARRTHPVLLGTAMEAGVTYQWRTLIPAFCTHVGFSLLVTGSGDVTLTCDDDTYDCVVPVSVGGTVRADAVWVFVSEPKTVAADGYWRCLEVTDETRPVERGLTLTCSSTAKVWGIVTRPMPRTTALA